LSIIFSVAVLLIRVQEAERGTGGDPEPGYANDTLGVPHIPYVFAQFDVAMPSALSLYVLSQNGTCW
jgi:hypothetical protein